MGCKIAVKKKCSFPISKKQFQQMKLYEYFQKDTVISTIDKKDIEEMQSIDSLVDFAF